MFRAFRALVASRKQNATQADYVEELTRDLSNYYGYLRELTEMFLRIFSPAECVEFMDANDKRETSVSTARVGRTQEMLELSRLSREPKTSWEESRARCGPGRCFDFLKRNIHVTQAAARRDPLQHAQGAPQRTRAGAHQARPTGDRLCLKFRILGFFRMCFFLEMSDRHVFRHPRSVVSQRRVSAVSGAFCP